jgi:cell division septum initiation protein DivIVA
VVSNENEISVPDESATNIVRLADRRFLASGRVEDANSPAPSMVETLEQNNRILAAALDEARAEIASLESQLEAAAVRLAKPAHHEPPYVDGYFGER